MTTETIVIPETVDLTAASVSAKKLPAVEIVAYSGGIMRVPQWGLIAIDLSGLELGQVAILADYESRRSGVLGHGQAEVRGNRLVVSGTISATGQAAREIVQAARNGFPWQASVGVSVLDATRVPAGVSAGHQLRDTFCSEEHKWRLYSLKRNRLYLHYPFCVVL